MKNIFSLIALFLIFVSLVNAQEQGMFFSKKQYIKKPLPKFAELRSQLPNPIYEQDTAFVSGYWKAWELAFKNFYEPTAVNGFVSQYIDAAFNSNVFLWDSGFMTMFCNYGYPLVPGICTLDNFYAKQHPTGEICREINRTTGKDYSVWVNTENKPLFSRFGDSFGNSYEGKSWSVEYINREIPFPNPALTLDALNHPIIAWAELESYRITGDKKRLSMVFEPLVQYYKAFQKYLQQGNGLYVTDWASMDNSPRNVYLHAGGTAVDISAEMVLLTRNLSEISAILGKEKEKLAFEKEAEKLTHNINQQMWDDKSAFYFDLTLKGEFVHVKSVSAFWTLIGQVATKQQAELLVKELENPATFNREHNVPTLAADEKGYDPLGGYWRGSVWAPINTMIIRGLEKYGYDSLAQKIAMNHLNNVTKVYLNTGTYWENYATDSVVQGNRSQKDFIGWSGIAPIMYFIEYAIGLKPDASKNNLVWNITSNMRCGMENFRFNGHVASLIASPNGKILKIKVISDGSFNLTVKYKGIVRKEKIKSGENIININ